MTKDRITLVLGGIGIKGATTIGVIQALVERGVTVKKVVATGMSAIVGACFALGRDPGELTARFSQFFDKNYQSLWGLEGVGGLPGSRPKAAARGINYFLRESLFCRENLRKESVFTWDVIEAGLSEVCGGKTTADLNFELGISSIALEEGKEVLLREGRLIDLVRAGVAFPGMFPPVKLAGREYTSSILYCEVPLSSLTDADRPIVAVDIPSLPRREHPRSLLEVLTRVEEIRAATLKENLLPRADFVIEIPALGRVRWGSYRRLDRLVELAKDATTSALEARARAG
jgi:NTE family protein